MCRFWFQSLVQENMLLLCVLFLAWIARMWWREKRGAGSTGIGVQPAYFESSLSALGLALSYMS